MNLPTYLHEPMKGAKYTEKIQRPVQIQKWETVKAAFTPVRFTKKAGSAFKANNKKYFKFYSTSQHTVYKTLDSGVNATLKTGNKGYLKN